MVEVEREVKGKGRGVEGKGRSRGKRGKEERKDQPIFL